MMSTVNFDLAGGHGDSGKATLPAGVAAVLGRGYGDVLMDEECVLRYVSSFRRRGTQVLSEAIANTMRKEISSKASRKNFADGHAKELGDVFLFKNPALYFEASQTILMIIALYAALWWTNFLVSALHQLHSPGWVMYSGLPGTLSFIAYIYVARCAAFLKAIVYLDHDAAEETIEQTEGAIHLGEIVKEKLLSRLSPMGDPEKELLALFQEIDSDGNELSRKEFQIFLEAMGITFSRKRWLQIFREIDRNVDNQVSYIIRFDLNN